MEETGRGELLPGACEVLPGAWEVVPGRAVTTNNIRSHQLHSKVFWRLVVCRKAFDKILHFTVFLHFAETHQYCY